jgi:hypothetical protein
LWPFPVVVVAQRLPVRQGLLAELARRVVGVAGDEPMTVDVAAVLDEGSITATVPIRSITATVPIILIGGRGF